MAKMTRVITNYMLELLNQNISLTKRELLIKQWTEAGFSKRLIDISANSNLIKNLDDSLIASGKNEQPSNTGN